MQNNKSHLEIKSFTVPGSGHLKTAFPSVLDNIETFRHFCPQNIDKKSSKRDFYLLYYRRKNLILKSKLENCSYSDNSTISKLCKSLACCSSNSIIDTTIQNETHITETSLKCKSKYCLICSRINSTKSTINFIQKINNPAHITFFKNKYWYFLTFTLKHNEDVRNYNYLPELRKNLNKFYRSKLFRDVFIQSKSKNNYGAINSIELTITKNGLHIHAHALICCNKLEQPINIIQNKIQNNWLKITNDSTQVRLDLIKKIKSEDTIEAFDLEKSTIAQEVIETFKYTVKSESLSKLTSQETDRMAEWIIETRGKNFINTHGYFRKLHLSDSDKNKEKFIKEKDYTNLKQSIVAKTISIDANRKYNHNFSKEQRKIITNDFYLTAITDYSADITDYRDQAKQFLNVPGQIENLAHYWHDTIVKCDSDQQYLDQNLNDWYKG